MNDIVMYLEIAVLLAFSAFFSASEMAFASVSTLRLKTLDETKSTLSTRAALKIAGIDPENDVRLSVAARDGNSGMFSVAAALEEMRYR